MRVQTFIGKVTMESLQMLDGHINQWLAQHNIEPKMIKQSFGYDRTREATQEEPVLVITIWY